ncbi:MAG: carboxylating nicotinate-nucleotide diphosphorylase [Pseudomonadota bacterium]
MTSKTQNLAQAETLSAARPPAPIPQSVIRKAVRVAMYEDLSDVGDITSAATIDATARMEAAIALREPGIISGLDVARSAFSEARGDIQFTAHTEDGQQGDGGTLLATVTGPARAILAAERVALNFIGRMCGIATLTAAYVGATNDTNATVVDTRKTTPGLRAFEKYAVRCGGGRNHRFGLFDAVLIKDNHIAACGGIKNALTAASQRAGHMTAIEIEVDTLDQLHEVDFNVASCVLLDNMSLEELRQAVAFVDGRAKTEASGGINLDTVADVAATGVDFISVGALTHSATVLDVGLDFQK